ncbi:MAG: hypothetical protein JWM80_5867 [Cyanobacteria bacterium RYN_339]|nr:hypothetical protein [Cyanobacteria bacterium RYN_339]
MANAAMASRVENDNVLVLERVFDAPRNLVFSMFKDAEHLKRWWGPRGWELPYCTVDFRVGGTWLYCMKCEDKNQVNFYGMESWGKAIYQEIVEPEKIVCLDYFCNAEGQENPDMPSTKVTLSFSEQGGKTKLVSRGEYVSAEALETVMKMGMLEGITQTWDRLEERLAAVQA